MPKPSKEGDFYRICGMIPGVEMDPQYKESGLSRKGGIRLPAETSGIPDACEQPKLTEIEKQFGLTQDDLGPEHFALPNGAGHDSIDTSKSYGCFGFLGSEGIRKVTVDYQGVDPDLLANGPAND